MRMTKQNMIPMKYALLNDSIPIYQTDSSGNIIYDNVDGELIPRDTGKLRDRYDAPVDFFANVNFSGQSEVRYTAYGVSRSQFDAIFYTKKGELPIDETSIIFVNAEPMFDSDGYTLLESADYRVVRVVPSLNYTTYLIRNVERAENDGN